MKFATLLVVFLQISLIEQVASVLSQSSNASNASTPVNDTKPSGEEEDHFGKVDADGYEWPTLYEEVDDMLDASLLMYPIAELRQVARDHPEDFSDPNDVMKEPITAKEVEDLLVENREVLAMHLEKEDLGVLTQVMDALVARQAGVGDIKRPAASTMYKFADDNSKSELVYAIATDDARKRVTVSFRGSQTTRDWLQDFQIWMETLENPLYAKGIPGQPKTLRVHHGFYEYLFYKTTSGETRSDGELKSKYERIIDQAVDLLKKNPGYKLFVTGHSLGAALASVFAFMVAATEESVPTPVTCVSIASPFVGGTNFRKAFMHLEKTGRLRYLRVANHKDLVTVMPFFALNWGLYKHVGVELRLYPDKYVLAYPNGKTVRRVFRNSVLQNAGLGAVRNHSPEEYNSRLDIAHNSLKKTYLNDLYEEL